MLCCLSMSCLRGNLHLRVHCLPQREWYSRWPVWIVVKLFSFLRTSPSPITSHFMLFSFSSSSSSCSSFSNVLTLYVAIFSRTPIVWWFFVTQRFLAPLYVVSADIHAAGDWGALAYLYFTCWFLLLTLPRWP